MNRLVQLQWKSIWLCFLVQLLIRGSAIGQTTAPPTATSPQVYVGAGTIASLTVSGTGLKWYPAATGGTPLASTSTLTDGSTYYVSQTGPNGESARTAVTVKRISESTQTVCQGATVADLSSTPSAGATARWYTTASGGTPLSSNSVLTAVTYYVEQFVPFSIETLGSGFSYPTGVSIQADGKIVVVDYVNSAIKRMAADGSNIVTLGSGFDRPVGVAIQADGKIVVADYGHHAIKRMAADRSNIVTLGSGFEQTWGYHSLA